MPNPTQPQLADLGHAILTLASPLLLVYATRLLGLAINKL